VKRLMNLLALLALSGLWLPGVALAQQAPSVVPPPEPVTRFLTHFDVANAPERFDQIMLVLDFAPGAWTPLHTHGGYVYSTVVEGDVAGRVAGMPATEERYKTGESFVETPGQYMEVGNPGSVKARVLVTAILPKGAAMTTTQAGVSTQTAPPGPTTLYRTMTEATRPVTPFEVVQFILDFAPGSWTPPHTHTAQGFATVITGEMTRRSGGTERTFKAGESWTDAPNVVHAAGNASGAFAQIGAAFLLTKGATLTTVQPAAALTAPVQVPRQLPRTGGVDLAVGLLAGGGIVGAGWSLRRRLSR
jgi:quercetin dioxygenase-like cupin family protein